MTVRKEPKPKKCEVCANSFVPARTMQKVCCSTCAYKFATEQAKEKHDKQQRKELRAAKEKIKSRATWIREAQSAFNSYIRARDAKYPCISCGRHHDGQYHAGHYRTVGGNPELRFDELNVHKQCAPCNNHLHGNIVNYRIGLEGRIGKSGIEHLEGPHEPKKYSIEELKEIKATYSRKARELMKGIE